ncbi:Hypothetical protein FKW44_012955, partial [Caligus rogercresseyi]
KNVNNVTAVRTVESNCLHTVKISKKIALIKKEQLKRKKVKRTMKLLDMCKGHQGPVTRDSRDLIERLTEKQLLSEIGYLRATLAPDIRQMRRIKVDGRFNMEKFSCAELKQSIKNYIKAESDLIIDVNALLKQCLSVRE